MEYGGFLRQAGIGTVSATVSHAKLVSVNVGVSAASAVVKVYDNTAASGTQLCQIDASAKGTYLYMGAPLTKGCTLDVSGGAADVTVVYA